MNLPVGIDPEGGIWSPLALSSRQDMLAYQEKQYSGVDYRDVVMDDRTSTPLNNFNTIVDLLHWRVSRQAEELAYCSIDGRGKEGKGITWKKFDLKVSAVATYLKNKVKVRPGDHLVLMYTHSEDYIYAIHACFCLGAVVIPMAPIDQNRLSEDAPAFLHIISDFNVKAIIVNTEVDHVMRQKLVSQHIKQSAQVLRIGVPAIYNTTKPSKQSHGCRELGYTVKDTWLQGNQPALVWTYWTPDQRRISVNISHETIMGMCKVQKETCQMTSSRPVLGSVRSTLGLGFLHTCLMGIFVGKFAIPVKRSCSNELGAPTYLVSPVDFAQNPMTLFVTLARYKVKDTYATSQMLDYAMSAMAGKGFQLQELKNLMIYAEGRPRVDICMYEHHGSMEYKLTFVTQTAKYAYISLMPAWTALRSTSFTRTFSIPWLPQDLTCALSRSSSGSTCEASVKVSFTPLTLTQILPRCYCKTRAWYLSTHRLRL
jgi:hypothetical protein